MNIFTETKDTWIRIKAVRVIYRASMHNAGGWSVQYKKAGWFSMWWQHSIHRDETIARRDANVLWEVGGFKHTEYARNEAKINR